MTAIIGCFLCAIHTDFFRCETSPVRAFLYPKEFPLNVNSQLPQPYFLSLFRSLLSELPRGSSSEVVIIHYHPWRSSEDNQHGRVYDLASEEDYRSGTRLPFSCRARRILFFMLSVRTSRWAMDTCGKFGEHERLLSCSRRSQDHP